MMFVLINFVFQKSNRKQKGIYLFLFSSLFSDSYITI